MGQSPCPSQRTQAGFGPLFPAILEQRFLPPGRFSEDEKKSRIKAGVAGGPPAGHFAPQCGSLRGFPVYQKWGQKQQAGITFAVTIPEPLLPQRKNRGHTSLLRCERLLFQTGRPTSKITPHETKIEALRGAGKCDA